MTKWTPQVAVTCILERTVEDQRQYLLVKRSDKEKRWPGMWTIPGGKVKQSDFIGVPTAINEQWYDVLEFACRRKVQEETGIGQYEYEYPKYLCNIALKDRLIISFGAKILKPPLILLSDELTDYCWATVDEVLEMDKNKQIIDGIASEIIDYNAMGLP